MTCLLNRIRWNYSESKNSDSLINAQLVPVLLIIYSS